MYVENTDGKYDEYFAAYKTFAIGVAKLMARENGGNGPNDTAIDSLYIYIYTTQLMLKIYNL